MYHVCTLVGAWSWYIANKMQIETKMSRVGYYLAISL